jgi:hypothetical protein
MNVQFMNTWAKNNTWALALCSVPIGYCFIRGVGFIFEHYGEIWPGRVIGFCIGNTIFAILTYLFMNEGLNTKTLICLGLSVVIILIQVLWK